MLHIINKSPFTNSALDSCLRVAQGGDVLLIEDAVYAAVAGAAEKQVREAMKQFKFHVLQADLEARGIADAAAQTAPKPTAKYGSNSAVGKTFTHNGVQVRLVPETLRVNLVDVFCARRPCREPAAGSHDLQAANRRPVPRSTGQPCHDRLASKV